MGAVQYAVHVTMCPSEVLNVKTKSAKLFFDKTVDGRKQLTCKTFFTKEPSTVICSQEWFYRNITPTKCLQND